MRTLSSCLVVLALCLFSLSAYAAPPPSALAGTWNVQTTVDFLAHDRARATCLGTTNLGDVTAYVWIVSVNSSGELQISAQGNTGFPNMTGQYDEATGSLW